jgi:hypothetical protein
MPKPAVAEDNINPGQWIQIQNTIILAKKTDGLDVMGSNKD